jgi:hypothetical protein
MAADVQGNRMENRCDEWDGAQGGYNVAVALSVGTFLGACRCLLYSPAAPMAWLHFAGLFSEYHVFKLSPHATDVPAAVCHTWSVAHIACLYSAGLLACAGSTFHLCDVWHSYEVQT